MGRRNNDLQFAEALGVGAGYEDYRDFNSPAVVNRSLGALIAERIGVDPEVATQVLDAFSGLVEEETVTGESPRNLQNIAHFTGSLVNSIERGAELRTLPSSSDVARYGADTREDVTTVLTGGV